MGLLNNRKNKLNEKVAILKVQLSTIETIKTKIESLEMYVSKQLRDIRNDLESVGLAGIYKKLQFSISSDFNVRLDNRKIKIETQILEIQGTKESKDKTKESKETDLNVLTGDYIFKLPLSEIDALISLLESKSSVAEDKRSTIKLFEGKIKKNQERVKGLDKNIKEIKEVKKPLLLEKVEKRNKAYKDYFILLQEEKKMLEELYTPLREELSKESLGDKKSNRIFYPD